MSVVDSNIVQVGASATALNNLVISTDGAGNATIEQGVIGGGSNRVVMTIDSAGKVNAVNGFSTALGATVSASESATNLTAAGNYLNAGITGLGVSQSIFIGVASASATAVYHAVVTGASCECYLRVNNTTNYMTSTLTFPVTGTYIVMLHTGVSHYSGGARNWLVATAIRIG